MERLIKENPAAAKADKKRYPTIEEITTSAQENGLSHLENEVVGEGGKVEVDAEFFELVKNKGYSMLQLITEAEYEAGLKKVKKDVANEEKVIKFNSGGTLIWLENKAE